MRAGVRLVGFTLALLAVFCVGLGVGRAVGPLGVDGNRPQGVDEQHEMRAMDVTR
jgi:hypothetical protein